MIFISLMILEKMIISTLIIVMEHLLKVSRVTLYIHQDFLWGMILQILIMIPTQI